MVQVSGGYYGDSFPHALLATSKQVRDTGRAKKNLEAVHVGSAWDSGHAC